MKAVHVETGEPAAVKLLSADWPTSAGFRHRFEAEIETLRKLNHPNIVRLFGFGEQDEHLFYAMELVAGSSLEEELGRGRRFDWREVARIGIEICPRPAPRPRPRRHPSRHQAGQPAADRRRAGEALRFRHRPALRQPRAHVGGQRAGHGRVHGAGAGRGPAGRAAFRPLQPRRGALRAAWRGGRCSAASRCRSPPEAAIRAAGAAAANWRRTCRPSWNRSSCNCWRRTPSGGFPTPTSWCGGWRRWITRAVAAADRRRAARPHRRRPAAAPSPKQCRADAGDGRACRRRRARRLPAALGDAAGARSPRPRRRRCGPWPPHAAGRRRRKRRSKPAGRFTPVGEEELDRAEAGRGRSPCISLQTVVLALGLAAVGLAIVVLLAAADGRRPVRADRGPGVRRRSPSRCGRPTTTSTSFSRRFPDDPRCQQLARVSAGDRAGPFAAEVRAARQGLGSGESLLPVEQAYLEAMSYARLDPERGMAKLQALIDLYDERRASPAPDRPMPEAGPAAACPAHRSSSTPRPATNSTLLQSRLDEADRLRRAEPDGPRRCTARWSSFTATSPGPPTAGPAVACASAWKTDEEIDGPATEKKSRVSIDDREARSSAHDAYRKPLTQRSSMFPTTRLRRLRYHPAVRRLVRETRLSPANLVLPLFVRPGENVRQEIVGHAGQLPTLARPAGRGNPRRRPSWAWAA